MEKFWGLGFILSWEIEEYVSGIVMVEGLWLDRGERWGIWLDRYDLLKDMVLVKYLLWFSFFIIKMEEKIIIILWRFEVIWVSFWYKEDV